MLKKLLCLVVMVAFLFVININATSFSQRNGYVDDVDKSDMCLSSLNYEYYCICVVYEDNDFEFIRIPIDIDVNKNDTVFLSESKIIIANTTFYYYSENGTKVVSLIQPKELGYDLYGFYDFETKKELNDVKFGDYFILDYGKYYFTFSKEFYESVKNGSQNSLAILNSLGSGIFENNPHEYSQESKWLDDERFLLIDTFMLNDNFTLKVKAFILEDKTLIDFYSKEYLYLTKLNETSPLFIPDDVFTFDYSSKNYNDVIIINSKDDFKNYSGMGICEISKENDDYKFDLFFKDDLVHLSFIADNFVKDYDLSNLLKAAFGIFNDELILELIFSDDRIVFNLSTGEIRKIAYMTISSTDYSCVKYNDYNEYYLYFNSNVSVDKFTSFKFDYEYHKVLNSITVTNYDYTSGSYQINETGEVLSSDFVFDDFFNSKTFYSDSDIRGNFSIGSYKVNNNLYQYRMKFLVIGTKTSNFMNTLDPVHWFNCIFGIETNDVSFDSFTPIDVSFVKNGKSYLNIKVDDDVVITDPTDIDNVEDPDFPNNKIDHFDIFTFWKLLINGIKNDNVTLSIFTDYFGAVIISIILIPVIIGLLPKIILFLINLIIIIISLPFKIFKRDKYDKYN